MINDEFTNNNIMLPVGNGHKIHIVDWGNKAAKVPFLVLHGGPGSCIKENHKTTFDPQKHRVIFFDQRGCGESLPAGSLEHNTTDYLVSDITKILDHLKIKKVNIYGYSWGSTLALVYTIRHPERIENVVIGGVYAGINDYESVFLSHCKTFFPEVYDRIIEMTPAEHHENIASYHINKTLHSTAKEQKFSAYVLATLESSISNNQEDLSTPINFEEFEPTTARIEAHYISNNCFLEDNYILNNADKIKSPVYIVQGRTDFVCPPNFAYALSKKIKNAKLSWAVSNHHSEHEVLALLKTICALIA